MENGGRINFCGDGSLGDFRFDDEVIWVIVIILQIGFCCGGVPIVASNGGEDMVHLAPGLRCCGGVGVGIARIETVRIVPGKDRVPVNNGLPGGVVGGAGEGIGKDSGVGLPGKIFPCPVISGQSLSGKRCGAERTAPVRLGLGGSCRGRGRRLV